MPSWPSTKCSRSCGSERRSPVPGAGEAVPDVRIRDGSGRQERRVLLLSPSSSAPARRPSEVGRALPRVRRDGTRLGSHLRRRQGVRAEVPGAAAVHRLWSLWVDPVNERFWSHIAYQDDSPDSCAIWCGSVDALGYGRVRVHGRLRSAHRVAWELAFGPIPANAQVRQRCRRSDCCRPEHLYLFPVVRLTPEAVLAIQTSPLGCRRLATLWSVSWRHAARLRASHSRASAAVV
jgi:hypothetical protein